MPAPYIPRRSEFRAYRRAQIRARLASAGWWVLSVAGGIVAGLLASGVMA